MARKPYTQPKLTTHDIQLGVFGDYSDPDPKPNRWLKLAEDS